MSDYKPFTAMLLADVLKADGRKVRLRPAGGIYDNLTTEQKSLVILDGSCSPTRKELIVAEQIDPDGVTLRIKQRGNPALEWGAGAVVMSYLAEGAAVGGGTGATGDKPPVITPTGFSATISENGGTVNTLSIFGAIQVTGADSVSWSLVTGPAGVTIADRSKVDTSFVIPSTPGVYEFRLSASNQKGQDSKTFTVTVPTAADRAATGDIQVSVSATALALVDTSGVSDPDGALTWSTRFVQGGEAILGSSPQYRYTTAGTFQLEARATDPLGNTYSFNKSVTIPSSSVVPRISGTNSATVGQGGSYQPDFAYTSPLGASLYYAWEHVSGPGSNQDISALASAIPAIRALPVPGTAVYRVTVTDQYGNRATRDLSLTTRAQQSTADKVELYWKTLTVQKQKVTIAVEATSPTIGAVTKPIQVTTSWGDGQETRGASSNASIGTASLASHTYAGPGTYTVRTTVTYSDGSSDSISQNVVATAASMTDLVLTYAGNFTTTGQQGKTLAKWPIYFNYGTAKQDIEAVLPTTFTVNWGDGRTDRVTANNLSELRALFFSNAGRSTAVSGQIYLGDVDLSANGDVERGHNYTQSGTYTTTWEVKYADGTTDSGSEQQTVSVATVNRPPSISPQLADQTWTVGQAIDIPVTIVDADGDTLNINVYSLPPGVTYDVASGKITGSPTAAQTAKRVDFQVSDGHGNSANMNFLVTVDAASQAPQLELGTPTAG